MTFAVIDPGIGADDIPRYLWTRGRPTLTP
jgi:hypothetical protein